MIVTRYKVRRKIRLIDLVAIVIALVPLGGCAKSGDRPDIGEVSGIVTLDGQPAPGVSVSYTQPGFRTSIGVTDESGRYELIYLRDIKGAAVGTHVVKFKRFPANGQKVTQLPSQYNWESEITREVKPGRNEFDFDLKSSS